MTKASRQSGKPVIEERLLNQILYYLPQLYELNQDLLREFRQRVANWYAKVIKYVRTLVCSCHFRSKCGKYTKFAYVVVHTYKSDVYAS